MDPLPNVEAEADRLLALDEAGVERELLISALRLGDIAQASWDELRRMDREFFDGLTSSSKVGVGSPEGA